MGHATRCIPLIRYYETEGFEVILSGNGDSLSLLTRVFPHLKAYKVPGISIRYSKKNNQTISIGFQLPSFLAAIKREQNALKLLVKREKPDFIISDNRYGFYHKEVASYLVTHQLQPPFPFFKSLGQQFISNQLKHFTEVWVPDHKKVNLSGKLSLGSYSVPIVYKGFLSDFRIPNKKEKVGDSSSYFILLSGPEPQRSLFLKAAVEWAQRARQKLTVAGNRKNKPPNDGVTLLGLLNPRQLSQELIKHSHVICRSGYSSLMDMGILGKHICLVPTPGQQEQEYLAEHLSSEFGIPTITQEELAQAEDLVFQQFSLPRHAYFPQKKPDQLN